MLLVHDLVLSPNLITLDNTFLIRVCSLYTLHCPLVESPHDLPHYVYTFDISIHWLRPRMQLLGNIDFRHTFRCQCIVDQIPTRGLCYLWYYVWARKYSSFFSHQRTPLCSEDTNLIGQSCRIDNHCCCYCIKIHLFNDI